MTAQPAVVGRFGIVTLGLCHGSELKRFRPCSFARSARFQQQIAWHTAEYSTPNPSCDRALVLEFSLAVD
ncbi:MAG: hypothetical protein R6U98_15780, partial [Pirellulaceae bacterium]